MYTCTKLVSFFGNLNVPALFLVLLFFFKIVSKKHNMPIVGLLGIGKVFQEEFSYSIKNYEGRGDGNLPLHYDLSLFSNPLSFGFVNIL